ncbi:Thioredoxin- transmembrane protein 2 [Mortierella alpina]|nr:Thioredoxin- transmembrane protein 2 [Mortierella alpina]
MSLAKRLSHPHYVANVCLAAAFPAYQLITHPESLNNSTIAAYLRYLLPATVVLYIKVMSSHSAEELVSVIALYLKVYSLYGFWTIAEDREMIWGGSWSGWWRVASYLFAWLCIFIVFPQPPYQGPSKIIALDPKKLEFLTTPVPQSGKGKGRAEDHSATRNRGSAAKITELDDNGELVDDDVGLTRQVKDQSREKFKTPFGSDLDPSHYWIIAFNATWSSPCRHFEAVLAGCSIKYEKKNVHFGKIDMDLFVEGEQIAQRFKINMAATTLDLPTLILFKDGKALKQLPLKLGTKLGGEVLGKVGWDRSESSVLRTFELTNLGTGKESFAQ